MHKYHRNPSCARTEIHRVVMGNNCDVNLEDCMPVKKCASKVNRYRSTAELFYHVEHAQKFNLSNRSIKQLGIAF